MSKLTRTNECWLFRIVWGIVGFQNAFSFSVAQLLQYDHKENRRRRKKKKQQKIQKNKKEEETIYLGYSSCSLQVEVSK